MVSVGAAPSTICVIPAPTKLVIQDGEFRITAETVIAAAGDAQSEAVLLIDFLAPAMGFRPNLVESASRDAGVICLVLEPSGVDPLGEEGYRLEVTPQTIRISADKPAGLFYGIQTLRQLLAVVVFSPHKVERAEWTVPCVSIVDVPRFGWRGLLIDPARHFIPIPEVKRFIDAMAIHKFNRLQIHLTDDTGWRIEIRKFPELTRIGSRMDFTEMQSAAPNAANSRFGGFYTQDQIRELLRYAAIRHIVIVPEIEMPAHTGAAIVSYPQLGLYPQKLSALPSDGRWKAHEWVVAPRPESVAFLSDVLAEVIELFPGPYIHIGGDEANISHWKNCPEMQEQIRQLGLKDEAELHSWFIRQLDGFLTRHGRRLVGWDEILQGGLAPGAVVMSWRGQEGGITAAQAGHDVIMAPTSHTYFDYYQGPAESEPRAIGGNLPLETVLQFEPIPPILKSEQARRILGGQGQLWGEFISDAKHREYMAWPRGAALAEVLWSAKAERDPKLFVARLVEHFQRLDAAGIRYRPLQAK